MIDSQHIDDLQEPGPDDAVLVVAPYLPLPADFGGAIRILELTKRIAARREVILLAPSTDPPRDFDIMAELGQFCDVTVVPASQTARDPANRRKRLAQIQATFAGAALLSRSSFLPQMQATMDRLFMTRSIGLVQYEFPESTLYRPLLPVPTVLDAHNIEYTLLRRIGKTAESFGHAAFNVLEWRKLRRFEHRAWNSVDLCVATSDVDSSHIERATAREVPTVPNGVNVRTQDVQESGSRHSGDPVIVFIGAMRHQPNADGAVWFVKEVLPIIRRNTPNVTVQIVGADPPTEVLALEGPGVDVTGRVKNVDIYLKRASVAIVPLHAGSGTRLKILEAFAAGIPVVSTRIGAEGIDGEPGTHFLLADNANEFAVAVQRLIGDVELRSKITTQARILAGERYSWDRVAGLLEGAHRLAEKRFYNLSESPKPGGR